MNYDSKSYLFYKLLDSIKGYECEDASAVVELLGNFRLRPGSLNVVQKEHVNGPSIESEGFAPENIQWNTLKNISISYGSIEIEGYYNGNQIKISISNAQKSNEEESDCGLTMVIIDKSKGIHCYNSAQYSGDSLSHLYQPLYAFYDENTLDTLINCYGYDEEALFNLAPRILDKEGFTPDKSCYTSIEELGFEKETDLIKSILTTMPYEELENKFDSIVNNKEEANSEKFIKYLKLSNGYRKQ